MENVICLFFFYYYMVDKSKKYITCCVLYVCAVTIFKPIPPCLGCFSSKDPIVLFFSFLFFSVFEEIPILDFIHFCLFLIFLSHVLSAALRARGTENLENDIGKDFNGCVCIVFSSPLF